ncbi:hypothetical protein PMAYCL1PPCAC_29041, partial [Pristionchus mayeri]
GADDEEEVAVEPDTHDSLLMAALLSTKELLPSPSVAVMRALSCPDLLMDSLAVLLYETRHLHFLNERFALPPPPKSMVALEAEREMDPPNSLVSTVSLRSGWDAVSARLSTSSIFNLFSDRVITPLPSLFSIDPTGVASTASTVSVPLSFWDTTSTVSVTDPEPILSLNPTSSAFTCPSLEPLNTNTSSTSSDLSDSSSVSSEVSSTSSMDVSSSVSTLFMDPSSAHSMCSGCPSSSFSLLTDSSLLLSSSSSICPDCVCVHSSWEEDDDDIERSRHTYVVSNSSSSGYESDVESEPVLLKKMTSTASATTQTEALEETSAARMLAECDSMLEKLMEMKKKLREML